MLIISLHYDNERHTLIGEHTRQTFRLGDEVEVRVRSVDLDERQIDFELASLPKGRVTRKSSQDKSRESSPRGRSTRGAGARTSRSRGDNTSDRNKAMSVREQLRKGKVPGANSPSDKADENAQEQKSDAPKRRGKAKPKSRAGKRIAAKKSGAKTSSSKTTSTKKKRIKKK